MVAFELPTGYLGDRLGRRTALAAGNAFTVLVMTGFAFATTTVLSSVSMVLVVISGTANVVGGYVAALIGPIAFLSTIGVTAAVLAGIVWVGGQPIRPTTHSSPTPAD